MYSPLVICLLCLFVAACASSGPQIYPGQIEVLGEGATRLGVQAVMDGRVGTAVLTDGRLFTLIFPWGENWGFVVCKVEMLACARSAQEATRMITQSLPAGKGNLTSYKTMSEFADDLLANGWQSVPPSAVIAAGGRTISQYVASVSTALTSVIVVPVLPIPDYADQLPQG